MNTSQQAALSIDTTMLEQMVYEAILSTGKRGAIGDELRHMLPGLAYSSVTARFFNLVRTGRVYRPGYVRKGDSGRMQQVMWADKYRERIAKTLVWVRG